MQKWKKVQLSEGSLLNITKRMKITQGPFEGKTQKNMKALRVYKDLTWDLR